MLLMEIKKSEFYMCEIVLIVQLRYCFESAIFISKQDNVIVELRN